MFLAPAAPWDLQNSLRFVSLPGSPSFRPSDWSMRLLLKYFWNLFKLDRDILLVKTSEDFDHIHYSSYRCITDALNEWTHGCVLPDIGNPIIKVRRSWDRLIFIMGLIFIRFCPKCVDKSVHRAHLFRVWPTLNSAVLNICRQLMAEDFIARGQGGCLPKSIHLSTINIRVIEYEMFYMIDW